MFESIKDKLRSETSSVINRIRIKVLGKNNEHLDFVIDSFYKLPPNQRTVALGAVIAIIFAMVIGLVSLYFSRVNNLDQELNRSFLALSKLRSYKVDSKIADENFEKWVDFSRAVF